MIVKGIFSRLTDKKASIIYFQNQSLDGEEASFEKQIISAEVLANEVGLLFSLVSFT